VEPKRVVAENIRARRAELGITQEQAAHAAGIHPVEFARAERGVRDLRVSTLVKIASGLEVAAGDLLLGLPDLG
jgi:transcriptional regulator with XRE-family HTH domain